jgi:hypothetical protein
MMGVRVQQVGSGAARAGVGVGGCVVAVGEGVKVGDAVEVGVGTLAVATGVAVGIATEGTVHAANRKMSR